MVELVRTDEHLRPGKGRKRAQVGGVPGRENQGRLGDFQSARAASSWVCTGREPLTSREAPAPGAPSVDGVVGGGEHPRVCREPEVVVGGEGNDRAAVVQQTSWAEGVEVGQLRASGPWPGPWRSWPRPTRTSSRLGRSAGLWPPPHLSPSLSSGRTYGGQDEGLDAGFVPPGVITPRRALVAGTHLGAQHEGLPSVLVARSLATHLAGSQ